MPQPTPEPRVITVDVPTVVQRGCPDRRSQETDYPDKSLDAVPRGDFEQLFRIARAGIDLRDKRLAEDNVQIKGCSD
jgi:hypothetical protein